MRTRRISRKLFGLTPADETSELGTSAIHAAVLHAITASGVSPEGDYLDVGSGTGELLDVIAARYPVQPFACDHTDRWMRKRGQSVTIADLNHGGLPFDDGRFALVTCAETVEHLENFRAAIREIYRVLKPGGLAVFTTPNVLNLRSRLRYLSSGFYNLFGPLPVNHSEVDGARGHITPVNWFYLAHALAGSGFVDLRVSVDKYQRRSYLALALLALPIWISNGVVYRRDRDQYKTVDASNDWMVRRMNSRDLLLGRTVVVSAVKPNES